MACPLPLRAQSGVRVAGRVVDSERHPLAKVEITVTNDSARQLATGQTASNGTYALTVNERLRSYTVSFRLVGYVMFSRVINASADFASLGMGDITLMQRLDLLQPMNVRAAKLVPTQTGARPVGASDMNVKSASDFLIDPSDLAALLARLPGVEETDGGLSILGAEPSQNRTIIDGADFSGSHVPRDAIQQARLSTNPFDPAQGRFSGGEVVVTTRRGRQLVEGTTRAQIISPLLSIGATPLAERPSGRWSSSGFASGPLGDKRLNGLIAYDASVTSAASLSLLSTRNETLGERGLSQDSVAAIADAVSALDVPLGSRSASPVFQGSALGRVDFNRGIRTSLTLTALGNWTRIPQLAVGALDFPSTAQRTSTSNMRVTLGGSTYFGLVLDEWLVSLGVSTSQSSPLTRMPSGRLDVRTLVDGKAGIATLRFAGAGAAGSSGDDHMATLTHTSSVVLGQGTHQLKLVEEATIRQQRTTDSSSYFGTYTYIDVARFLRNQPDAFERRLSVTSTAVHATTLGASLGDSWRAIAGKLDLQGGLRVDAQRFGPRPEFNRRVGSAFAVRTDRVPDDLSISPRLGFRWRPRGKSSVPLVPEGTTTLDAQFGRGVSAPYDAGGVALDRDANYITLSGGIGAFRGVTGLDRVAAAAGATGLSNSVRTLSCVGSATPLPKWRATLEESPAVCAEGTGVFADTSRSIVALAPQFRPPVGWRGVFAINGLRFAGLALLPQFNVSYGANNLGRINRNVRAAPSFTLANEGGRPVYATPSGIDARTGLISASNNRLDDRFGNVTEFVTDRHIQTTQVTLAITPTRPLRGGGSMFLVYSLTDSRMQSRGFDGTTGGDPRTVEWSPSSQPRHHVELGASGIGNRWLRFDTRIVLTSGAAFTPTVAQDINGDGQANDRAFVFSQAERDAVVAAAMQRLLTAATPNVARCLTKQIARVAETNSCRDSWRARVDVAINVLPAGGFGLGDRFKLTANVLNAGSAIVRIFRLYDTPLARPTASSVDRQLLYVTGFDSVQRQFRYVVNEQFGRARTNFAAQRLPPMRLQVGAQWLLTPRRSRQIRPPAPTTSRDSAMRTLRNELVRRLGPGRVAGILSLSDSLRLDDAQVTGIRGSERAFVAARDSLLGPVVIRLLDLGTRMKSQDVDSQMRMISRELGDLDEQWLNRALAFLSPSQRAQFDKLKPR